MSDKPQTTTDLPKRLRQKSKGWKLVRGKFLSETPQLLCDAADEIERLKQEQADFFIAAWNGNASITLDGKTRKLHAN